MHASRHLIYWCTQQDMLGFQRGIKNHCPSTCVHSLGAKDATTEPIWLPNTRETKRHHENKKKKWIKTKPDRCRKGLVCNTLAHQWWWSSITSKRGGRRIMPLIFLTRLPCHSQCHQHTTGSGVCMLRTLSLTATTELSVSHKPTNSMK